MSNTTAGEVPVMRELSARTVIAASCERVWEAWNDPQQLATFFGPVGATVPADRIELDVRTGGAFGVTFVGPDGQEYRSNMTFREVQSHERLVYGWDAQRGVGGGEVTISLAEVATETGHGTEVTYQFVGETTAAGLTYLQGVAPTVLERLAAAATAG